MLRAAARLHRDQARYAVGEVIQEPRPCQLQIHDLARLQVDPVQLEHSLRRIHAYDRSANRPSRTLRWPGKTPNLPLQHLDAVGPRGSTSALSTFHIRGGRRPFHFLRQAVEYTLATCPIFRGHLSSSLRWCPARWCKRFSAGVDGGAMESSSGPAARRPPGRRPSSVFVWLGLRFSDTNRAKRRDDDDRRHDGLSEAA